VRHGVQRNVCSAMCERVAEARVAFGGAASKSANMQVHWPPCCLQHSSLRMTAPPAGAPGESVLPVAAVHAVAARDASLPRQHPAQRCHSKPALLLLMGCHLSCQRMQHLPVRHATAAAASASATIATPGPLCLKLGTRRLFLPLAVERVPGTLEHHPNGRINVAGHGQQGFSPAERASSFTPGTRCVGNAHIAHLKEQDARTGKYAVTHHTKTALPPDVGSVETCCGSDATGAATSALPLTADWNA
jgi:hypothetical protein